MRNKLSYLIGVAFLLCCSTSTLTSCLEIDETIDTAASGGGEEDSRLPKISGSYFEDEDGDNELYMTYNGRDIFSRKVMLTPDEKNETAIFTFSGTEINLSGLFNDLLDFKFTTYSPIPGVEKLIVRDVKLNLMEDGKTYSFEGKYDKVDDNPKTYDDYKMTFTGTVKQGEMKIDIKCKILGEDLLGTWELDANNTAENSAAPFLLPTIGGLVGKFMKAPELAPLWVNWDSNKKIALGTVNEIAGQKVDLVGDVQVNATPNELIGLITTKEIVDIAKLNIENLIRNSLNDATPERTGGMYMTYSYSGDFGKPAWGGGKDDPTSNNIVRYHYDKEIENKVYLEINPSFLVSALSGITGTSTASVVPTTRTVNNTASTRADQYNTIRLGKLLVEQLTPALQKGIPCLYTIDSSKNLRINIEGKFLRDVLRIIAELGNDEFAFNELIGFLNNDPSLKSFVPTITKLIKQLPEVLDPCEYVNLGFKLHNLRGPEPEEPENPEVPENPDPENPEVPAK